MKIIKKMVLTLIVIFASLLIGGYFYFDKKFSPPENYLQVSGNAENIPIKWISDNENPHSALLLPVHINGVEKVFYMQLDFGSPITVFYQNSLKSIQEKFPKQKLFKQNKKDVSLGFKIQELDISSRNFQLLNYGKKTDFENSNTINIVGTIGTDLLEKRTVTLDFVNNFCSFEENKLLKNAFDFQFKKRKLLFPAKIGNQNLKLLYDSGTSGYELIVNKEEWLKYKMPKGKIKKEKGNSWGNILTVISAPANEEMQFGNAKLPITEVTYIEGISKMQIFLMKRSGMQGMIGNKLFINHKLSIDCKNEKFSVE